ncbi:MAG: AgmX/PglI C-terminal domain-containing protein [Polyangiaceae bacterium]
MRASRTKRARAWTSIAVLGAATAAACGAGAPEGTRGAPLARTRPVGCLAGPPSVCPELPPPSGDPTPWPRPSQLVDRSPRSIVVPVGVAEIAAVAHRDEGLAKLDASRRALLVAADDAYAAALAGEDHGAPSDRWAAARTAYEGALAAPGAGDLEGYARFRLARVLFFQDDPAALDQLDAVVALAATTAPGAAELAAHARTEWITVYARLGDPARAFERLRASHPSGPEGDATARAALVEVAEEALRVGAFANAEGLFQALVDREPAAVDACVLATHVLGARVARGAHRTAWPEAIDGLLARVRGLRASGADASALRACASAVVSIASDIATTAHVEAAGARGEVGSLDRQAFETARRIYEALRENFTDAELEQLSAGMPERARATPFRLTHALADLAWTTKDWRRAAAAYDAALALDRSPADALEITYRAAVAHLNVWRESKPALPLLLPGRETPPDEDELARIAAEDRLICVGAPPRSAGAVYDDWVSAKFDRGVVRASHRMWRGAAVGIRGIAFDHPDHADAPTAARLYLEIAALDTATDTTCAAELERAAPPLYALYCSTGDAAHADWATGYTEYRTDHAETCAKIRSFAPDLIPPPLAPKLDPLPAEPRAPSVRVDRTATAGATPIEAFERVVDRAFGGAVGCYEAGRRADPDLEGQLRARLTIARDGSVAGVELRASRAIAPSPISRCFTRWFAGLSFPQPEGGVATLEIPIGFTRTFVLPPQPENPARMRLDPGL